MHRVLFHSLRNDNLHELTTLPTGWRQNHDLRKPDNPFLQPQLFVYRRDTGTAEPFADTPSPHLAAEANRLVFTRGTDRVDLLDVVSNSRSTVKLGPSGRSGELALSPDGRFALVPLVLSPVNYWGHSTIVDLRAPSRRCDVGPTVYRVVWAR